MYGWPVLLIPIVIHLFNLRRYRTLYFPNVRFLQQIQRERRIRNRLRDWLLLASRLLALASLLMAFALPVSPNVEGGIAEQSQAVSLYLDNSFSMSAEGKDGPLYRKARRLAAALINQMDAGASVQVQTNNQDPRLRRFYAPSEARPLINEIEPGPATQDLHKVMERQSLALGQQASANRLRVVFCDFQRSTCPLDALVADSSVRTLWVPLAQSMPGNLFIDTVTFETPFIYPGQKTRCKVRLVNTGEEDVEDLSVHLTLNGSNKAVGQVSVPGGGSQNAELVFTPDQTGWQRAEVHIKDYPVTFDDHYYFTFRILSEATVLQIAPQAPSSVASAYQTDDYFQLTTTRPKQADYGSIDQYEMIMLMAGPSISGGAIDRLKDYVAGGGNLLVIPRPQAPPDARLFRAFGLPTLAPARKNNTGMRNPDVSRPFFEDVFESMPRQVDMPKIKKYYPSSQPLPFQAEVLLSLRNEAPIFYRAPFQGGNVFVLHTALDEAWANLEEHALFVPLCFKTALYGGGRTLYQGVIASQNSVVSPIRPQQKDEVLELASEGNKQEAFIPQQRFEGNQYRLFPGASLSKAGFYRVRPHQDSPEAKKAWIAFNYDRRESALSTHSATAIEQAAERLGIELADGNLQSTVQQASAMTEPFIPRWRWFLVAGLLFLVLEVLITKLAPA